MEATKILFIINRKSGSEDGDDLEKIIHEKFSGKNIDFSIHLLKSNTNKELLRKEIDKYHPDIVAAAGGDGTINLVASAIKDMSVKFGLIPTGSANGLATELGIPEKPEDAIDVILNGYSEPMDIIKINDDHICLHLCDAGINARIVKEFENDGKRGFAGYFKHFFREIAGEPGSFKCRIKIQNENVYSHKAVMVIIANASSYRTGANINPLGKIDDGLFEVVVIQPHSMWKWKSLIGAFTGTLHKQSHIETYNCTDALVSITPPQELQIDGETLGKYTLIKAQIRKHALNVILPSK